MEEEVKFLKLTDAFVKNKDVNSDAELIVKVININAGYNEKLKQKCQMLFEYCEFVGLVREYSETYKDKSVAVNLAIEKSIELGILKDILRSNKVEILGMMLEEFDVEKYERTLLEQGIEQGLQQGIEQGLQQGLAAMIKVLRPLKSSKEEVLSEIKKQEGFENIEIEDIEKYWE